MTKLEDALKALGDKVRAGQRELDLGPFKLTPYKGRSVYALCPPPIRMGQDQYRCQKCGNVWDVDETRPECQDT